VRNESLILLVEDDDSQRELLDEVLTEAGYAVAAASSPVELVNQLWRCPALVLMDVVGIAGPQVFKAIASLARRPGLVLMSGDLRVARAARHMGADAFIAKPYELWTLLNVVHRVLSVPQIQPDAQLASP
jgi:two-component system, OmpR family, response regulator VicR